MSKAQAEVIAELRLEVDGLQRECERLENEVERLKAEALALRVKNKFLREKAGYFRDDIEDASAGRDGSTGVFASPRSGSTPEGALLDLGAAERRAIAERQREVTTQECVAVLSRSPFQMVREYTHGVGAAGRGTRLVTEETP